MTGLLDPAFEFSDEESSPKERGGFAFGLLHDIIGRSVRFKSWSLRRTNSKSWPTIFYTSGHSSTMTKKQATLLKAIPQTTHLKQTLENTPLCPPPSATPMNSFSTATPFPPTTRAKLSGFWMRLSAWGQASPSLKWSITLEEL